MTWFWNLELIDSPMLSIVGITAAVLIFSVFLVRPRHPLASTIGGLLGAVAFAGVVLFLQQRGTFEGSLPAHTTPWVLVSGAGVGIGVVALTCRPWWRRIIAVFVIIASVLTLGVAVNRLYGVTHTPGAIFGVDALPQAELPQTDGSTVTIASWKPPADMPQTGQIGTLTVDLAIPTSKPYNPRPASVYLPPAALVKNPPQLPVMVAMMGQPGSPDPKVVGDQLAKYAAAHQGLAPIMVIVDQLDGNQLNDPVCHDSTFHGAVSTYVNTDVVAYIKSHFNVLESPRMWTIAGYSNGGACAWQWGTEFPNIWGNILDVSGNEFPGSQNQHLAIDKMWMGMRPLMRPHCLPCN